jgi:hypothetical protein
MRRAADYRCVFLGQIAEHLHHSSWRDADGKYIYPDLVLPVARSQHGIIHKVGNSKGFGEDSELPSLALAHYRISQELDLLGRHHGDGTVTFPAFYVVELGRVHLHVAEQFGAPK